MFGDGFTANTSSWNKFTQWHNSGTTGGTTNFNVRGNEIWFEAHGGPTVDFVPELERRIVSNRVNNKSYDIVSTSSARRIRASASSRSGSTVRWSSRRRTSPRASPDRTST
jgi:hypothetical protein